MLCYRCGGHVKDGSEKCGSCGQAFALGLKPGPIAGFGTGSRRHRVAIEGTPYKPGDAIASRYQVKEHVGAGPVGWVYRVLDTEADVDVCLKVISPRFLQMAEERKAFFAEMQKAKALVHPNLVRVYDAGDDQERPFLALQFLEGLTLRRIMDLRRQKGQGFSLREVEPIVAQIASALEAAGPVFAHGDLKPDNVIVLPDLLKLTDFGLATSLPRAPFMAAQKAGGVHRYLAPEFLLGDRLDARADVYGLGVMLAEMLSGVQYEPALDLTVKNPALPRGVQDIFRRAVSAKAHERYGSAAELADELSDLLEKGDLAPAPGATTKPNARLPLAASGAHPPPMPHAMAPSMGVSQLGTGGASGSVAAVSAPPLLPQSAPPSDADEVVIEEMHTDPRVRIARALAAQDEQIRADARKPSAHAAASAGATQIPGTLQTHLSAADAAPVAALGKSADAAAVAARLGAPADILTAETNVKAAPTAPAGHPSLAAVAAPAPAASAQAEVAADEDQAADAEVADVSPGDEPTQLNALPAKRRGRGRREEKKHHGRGRRVAGSPLSAPPPAEAPRDAAWALVTGAPNTAPVAPIVTAPVVHIPVAPVVVPAPAAPARAAAPLRSAAPKAAPSFGNLVEKKSKLSLPMKAVAGLVVLILVVAAVALFRGGQGEPVKDEGKSEAAAAPASPSLPAADKAKAAAAPVQPAPVVPAAPAKTEAPVKAVAPAPAPKPPKAALEAQRPSRKAEAERSRRRAAADERHRALVARMTARREARTASHKSEQATEKQASDDEDRGAAASKRAEGEAIAKAALHRSAMDSQVATSALPVAAPAPAATPVKTTGGIPGLDEGELLASRQRPERKVVMAGPAPVAAPPAAALAVPAVATLAKAPAVAAVARTSGSCPAGMEMIPGGRTLIGSDPKDDLRNFGDRNLTAVEVPAFCVDRFEYPNAPGKLPRVGIGFEDAAAACRSQGKRLCAEEEWEKACKGPGDLRFPYGAAFDPDACNTQDKGDSPRQVGLSGAFDRCKSGYGVSDLSGNVAEWTSSSYEGGSDKAVKGGSASRPGFDDRCASRRKAKPGLHDVKVGFRCCSQPR